MLKVHANVLQVVLVKNLIKKLKMRAKGYKKCADQACHNNTAKRVRRVATPVKSSYSLRSRGTKK